MFNRTFRSTIGSRIICSFSYRTSNATRFHSTSTTPKTKIQEILNTTITDINKINTSINNKYINDTTAKLEYLERGIKKADELTAQFTDYTYKFTKLPANFGNNQFIKINKELNKSLESIISHFDAPIAYAFGYGSGVFKQSGYTKNDKPQIDLIFGVNHPSHWHSLNMRQNPNHYSSLKYFGSEFISKFQDIGAGIYFNPFVELNGQQIKYGVVSITRLLKDLATWDSFYLAGRLQKPVKVLKNDLRVQYWNQFNLKAAATVSRNITLLKNNGKFDEFEFYKNITSLSYLGDVRYKLGGEHPNKISNIVEKNFENFQYYYSPIVKDILQNQSYYLPKGFTNENVLEKLEEKISSTSLTQAAKGILTAGLMKSVKYAWAKKLKAMKN
ncbi:putative phosphatidate cytidylyltransferase SCDLUD_003898 [Saccharomycodes ludwigii]|uniref:putative phosphatidate cytidylyltransferase n=1 Tax=Saccharomycodes ludwigii TaxID=36035 RepID=UPI001E867E34|nr:hypothetical protein SCDLUD_003898 [Saccharomycodes ludwigii]KAH3899618.1 hypothetical protein SCDLUD_003898 [Saccharomycodes ludwigii]